MENPTQQTNKSKLEQLAKLTTPAIRMQMIQLGLNPFKVEDIEHFKQISSNKLDLSFLERFKAAWTFLFKNKINEGLEIVVLKKINSESVAVALTEKDSANITEAITLKPGQFFFPEPPPTESIMDVIKARAEAEKQKEQIISIPVPVVLESELPSTKRTKVTFDSVNKGKVTKLPIGRGSGKKIEVKEKSGKITPEEWKRRHGNIKKKTPKEKK